MSFHSELEIYIEKKEIFMKKIVKLLVSLLMALSLTFCFVVQSFAFDYEFYVYDEEEYYHESIASAYFTHNYNFSSNEVGSCTFVAIQMLLSYYDSFWSDEFVSDDDKYELSAYEEDITISGNTLYFWNAPGVLAEDFYDEDGNPRTSTPFDEIIEEHKDDYFQLYLMSLAKEEGLIVGQDPSYMAEHPDDTNGDFSLSRTQMVDFLEFYLYNVVTVEDDEGAYVNLTQQQITVHSMLNSDPDYSEEAVRNQLVNLVSSGTPVIYCGKRYETDDETLENNGQNKVGHAMIAYDYNPETDNVYYHMGSYSTDMLTDDVSNDFDFNPSIIWLEINENAFPHECSNNYHEVETGETICLCKLDIHPAHTHSLECIESDASSHIPKCSDCNEIDENALSYVRIDGITHSINCVCGYHSVGVHIVKSGTHTCLQCRARVENGYVAIESIGQEVSINSTQIDDVTHITDNGIIVLSDEDYEDFINGTLTIQELYERFGLVYD